VDGEVISIGNWTGEWFDDELDMGDVVSGLEKHDSL